MLYQSTSWAGDSGASLLLFDGQLVGIHLGIVNDLQRLKEQASTVRNRLDELASSVNSLIEGSSTGCLALLASALPEIPMPGASATAAAGSGSNDGAGGPT
jgi:hypothetical protein